MLIREFFATDNLHSPLFEIISLFKLHKLDFENARTLNSVIASMTTEASTWDMHCQFAIKKYGDAFRSSLITLGNTQLQDNFDIVRAYVLLFIMEFDLSTTEPLVDFLQEFKDKAISDLSGRAGRAGAVAAFGIEQLPTAIIKHLLSSEQVGSIKNIDTAATNIAAQLGLWDLQLKSYEDKVTQLEKALERQKHGFNFVGLAQGFSDMETIVSTEARRQKRKLGFFGGLILAPATLDMVLLASGKIDMALMSLAGFIAWAVVSLTCTVVFLYFFRIILREVDSKDAQLLQLRLRMTLCQFVQNYTDFASEVKKEHPDTLTKFESLIFSGIVGTQDKLPSTFDGFEQLGSLIKSARGG